MTKKISFLLSILLVGSIYISDVNTVKAQEERGGESGTFLKEKDSAEVVEVPLIRGAYLQSGSSTICEVGKGKIAAGGNTVGQKVVDEISINVRVQRLEDGKWAEFATWTATRYNSGYVSTSRTMKVPRGYYYRVYCRHYAGANAGGSYTNGLWI